MSTRRARQDDSDATGPAGPSVAVLDREAPDAAARTQGAGQQPLASPIHQSLKRIFIARIRSGELGAGDRLPSEHEVMRTWGVSRRTAHRAMSELATEGWTRTVHGAGSFVADATPVSERVLERRLLATGIADEIESRGNRHRVEVVRVESWLADESIAWMLGLLRGRPYFISTMVHYENDTPVQVEHRLVNPAAAPRYLEQDFTTITPIEYIRAVHPPITDVEEAIEVFVPGPDDEAPQLLNLAPAEPCLVVRQRIFSGTLTVCSGVLIHPGSSHRITRHLSWRDLDQD